MVRRRLQAVVKPFGRNTGMMLASTSCRLATTATATGLNRFQRRRGLSLLFPMMWRNLLTSLGNGFGAAEGFDMIYSGRMGLSHYPRAHHRYRRRHGLPWLAALALMAVAVVLWVVPSWRP